MCVCCTLSSRRGEKKWGKLVKRHCGIWHCNLENNSWDCGQLLSFCQPEAFGEHRTLLASTSIKLKKTKRRRHKRKGVYWIIEIKNMQNWMYYNEHIIYSAAQLMPPQCQWPSNPYDRHELCLLVFPVSSDLFPGTLSRLNDMPATGTAECLTLQAK